MEGVGPHPRPRVLDGGYAACGAACGCTPKHVVLGECGCAKLAWLPDYHLQLLQAVQRVEASVPKLDVSVSTPMGQWCACRRVVRLAVEAAGRRARGEGVGEAEWLAVRQVAAGLLPRCAAVEAMEEQARRKVEVEVARAVVELQQVILEMTRRYKSDTRRARAQKSENLDAWWREHVTERDRQRGVRTRVVAGLRRQGARARARGCGGRGCGRR